MEQDANQARAIAGVYSPEALAYEEIWGPLLRPFGMRLLDMLPLEAARRVLDLGCGVGLLLPEIHQRAPRAQVVGSDLTERMLRLASPRFGRVVMDAMHPAFAPGAFDAVVSAFVLFHLQDPVGALNGVRGALRPGGGVAACVWGSGEVFPARDAWNDALDGAEVPPDPAAGVPTTEQLMNSPEKLGSLLSEAGFRHVRAETAEWTQRWDIDAFVDWRSRMGPARRRLELLSPERSATVIARARDRIASLSADDLVDHDVVVLASGIAP